MTSTVLMTADCVGGVWTYAVELAGALAAHDVAVELATMGRRPSGDQRRQAAAAGVARVHESDFALEWMDDPWDDVRRAGEWLLDLEASIRPDVVHLNGYAHGALPWRAPTVVVAHSCVASWWTAVRGEELPPARVTYREYVTAGLAAAGAVVAPTRAMLRELHRCYGVVGGTVVPNGRSSAWVRPLDKRELVLATGRVWDDAKNLRLLERVAPDLPWPVVVAGDASPAPHRWPAAGAGVAATTSTNEVRYLGRLPFDDLVPWLLSAAVYVSPARYEPFGLGILEAALAGCALVLGDIPTLREVWGDAALYVDPDDGAELVAAVRALAGDERGRAVLAARARARAATATPERMAEGYLDVYRHLPVPTAANGAGR